MSGFIKFYNKHRYEIFTLIAILIFIVLFFIDRKKEYGKYNGIDSFDTKKKKWIWKGKNENKCRSIIEKYFGKEFNKIRPDFLKQPNGKNLELDMYNKDLNLACEYNGIQHVKYSPFFHKSYQDFIDQQNRDNFKKKKCEELGIKLLSISHKIKFEDLESYIHNQLKTMGY